MSRDEQPRRKSFGRIDPFVWVPVFGLLLLAVVMVVVQFAVVSIFAVIIAGLLVLLDSWMNRPDPRLREPRRGGARRGGTGQQRAARDSRDSSRDRSAGGRHPSRQPQRSSSRQPDRDRQRQPDRARQSDGRSNQQRQRSGQSGQPQRRDPRSTADRGRDDQRGQQRSGRPDYPAGGNRGQQGGRDQYPPQRRDDRGRDDRGGYGQGGSGNGGADRTRRATPPNQPPNRRQPVDRRG
jgi:hypothetical protein